MLAERVNTADENGDSVLSFHISLPYRSWPEKPYYNLPVATLTHTQFIHTVMTFYDDRVHDFDPYLGLDFTWMDSPSSEWLQPLTEDHIDETIAHIGTGIGMEVPLIDEAAASRNS